MVFMSSAITVHAVHVLRNDATVMTVHAVPFFSNFNKSSSEWVGVHSVDKKERTAWNPSEH